MGVIDELSTSLKLKIQEPNIALAKQIVENNDQAGIIELINELNNKKLAGDCIKVLYEIGYLNASLIDNYADIFLKLLAHKDNRMQWGAMTALAEVSKTKPEVVYENLSDIIYAANNGSVITKDQAFNILIRLAKLETYYDDVFSIINNQLSIAPNNQFPKYVEQTFEIIKPSDVEILIKTIELKIDTIDVLSKRKRVEKILDKLKKQLFK